MAADQKRKAGIGTVHPGSGGKTGTATSKKPSSFKDFFVQASKGAKV
jgi:hypothetical protein